MSAYSASPPVTASTTEPKIATATPVCAVKNAMPIKGFIAAKMPGALTTSANPMSPRERNHTSITGPNTLPMTAVPNRSTANNPVISASEITTTYLSKSGESTFKPSTALRTEMAGVIMLSPKNSAAPKAPAIVTGQRKAESFFRCCKTSAVSAKIPPSPRLSARMMMNTYLIVTTKIKAQVMSDKIPNTACMISGPPLAPAASTDTFSAYKGEVPMSPKTTPNAPMMRAAVAPVEALLWWWLLIRSVQCRGGAFPRRRSCLQHTAP